MKNVKNAEMINKVIDPDLEKILLFVKANKSRGPFGTCRYRELEHLANGRTEICCSDELQAEGDERNAS